MSELVELGVGDLRGHPLNYPDSVSDVESFSDLVSSVERYGVMNPLCVREFDASDAGGEYQILSGHRRWKACKELGLSSVLCMVFRGMSDDEALQFLFMDNVQHRKLDCVQESYAVNSLIGVGKSLDFVAGCLGRSKSWVTMRQGLLDLGDSAKMALSCGDLTIGAANEILKVDEVDRQYAEQLVLSPSFQSVCLSSGQAADVISNVILHPKKLQSEWEMFVDGSDLVKDVLEDLDLRGLSATVSREVDKKFSGAMLDLDSVVQVAEGTENWIFTDAVPDGEIKVLDFAIRHKLDVCICADLSFSGGMDFSRERVRCLVSVKMLMLAESVRVEYDCDPWLVADKFCEPKLIKKSASLDKIVLEFESLMEMGLDEALLLAKENLSGELADALILVLDIPGGVDASESIDDFLEAFPKRLKSVAERRLAMRLLVWQLKMNLL